MIYHCEGMAICFEDSSRGSNCFACSFLRYVIRRPSLVLGANATADDFVVIYYVRSWVLFSLSSACHYTFFSPYMATLTIHMPKMSSSLDICQTAIYSSFMTLQTATCLHWPSSSSSQDHHKHEAIVKSHFVQ